MLSVLSKPHHQTAILSATSAIIMMMISIMSSFLCSVTLKGFTTSGILHSVVKAAAGPKVKIMTKLRMGLDWQ